MIEKLEWLSINQIIIQSVLLLVWKVLKESGEEDALRVSIDGGTRENYITRRLAPNLEENSRKELYPKAESPNSFPTMAKNTGM